MAAPTYFNSSWPAVPLASGKSLNSTTEARASTRCRSRLVLPRLLGSGTAVTVAAANVTATSMIVLTPVTPGGTRAGYNITSITPGTGFQVTFGSSDTTVHNYAVIGCILRPSQVYSNLASTSATSSW